MSEPIRRRIVEVLASGEHSAGLLSEVIVAEFSVSPAACSHHLRTLRETGWVSVRIEASARIYVLDPEALDRLGAEIDALFELWASRTGFGSPVDPLRSPRAHRRAPRGKRGHRFSDIVVPTPLDDQSWLPTQLRD